MMKSHFVSKIYHLTCRDVAMYHDKENILIRHDEVILHFKNISSHTSCNTEHKIFCKLFDKR